MHYTPTGTCPSPSSSFEKGRFRLFTAKQSAFSRDTKVQVDHLAIPIVDSLCSHFYNAKSRFGEVCFLNVLILLISLLKIKKLRTFMGNL